MKEEEYRPAELMEAKGPFIRHTHGCCRKNLVRKNTRKREAFLKGD